mgnify:CR=1 FL=1
MFGSLTFRYITGDWHHVGYLTIGELSIPADTTIPKGTWMSEKVGEDVAGVMQYASGLAVGFTTEDIIGDTASVQLTRFKERTIGKIDLPAIQATNKAVSLRVPHQGSEMEFEGAGAAAPGNLVCTSGTGSLSSSDVAPEPLSFHKGCIRKAQSGDLVQLILLESGLTVESAIASALRIRVRSVSGYVAP